MRAAPAERLRSSRSGGRKDAGFSLVEVLAAVALLSISMLGLLGGTLSSVRVVKMSRERATATALAQDRLEALKKLAEEGQPIAAGTDTPRAGFVRTWTSTPDTPQPGVTQLTVSIAWTDYVPHQRTFSTIVVD